MIEIKESWQYKPYFDEYNQIQLVLHAKDLHYSDCGEWIIIGRPGVDGIDFRIKANSDTPIVYAHYPYEDRNIEVAANISDLIIKWAENKITL